MVMFHTSKCLDASQDAIVIGFGAMPKPTTLWRQGRAFGADLAGCQMVTLLLDHKADPRCLNNLGVMLTCLLFCDFILPEIQNMAKMEPFLEKEIPIGILIFGGSID